MNWKRVSKWTFRGGMVVILLTGFAGVSALAYVSKEVHQLQSVNTELFKSYESSRILDKEGNVIWQNTQQFTEPLTYQEIPTLYREGLIAVEDRGFWKNKGFSNKAVLNAVLGTLYSKINKAYTARGGSTLEQQLIKNVYYNGGHGVPVVKRKIGELFLSRQMDDNYSKEDIFTMYVNRLGLSENTIGLKKAMEAYFGKSPKDYEELSFENVSQLAYLIGLGQAPSAYNLYEHPEAGVARRDVVLSVLKDQDLISEELYEEAKEHDIVGSLQERYSLVKEQQSRNLQYKTYTDGVLDQVKDLGYDIYHMSLTVDTFLDPVVYDKITKETWNMKYLDENQQIAVSVIDKDGIVVGMVGGRSFDDEWNRAMQQTRSSGSSMKPFTAYGPLLQYKGDQYHSGSLFSTSNYKYPGTNTIMYNWGQLTYGNRTLQDSLRLSLNTPVARIDDEILGPVRMKMFLHQVGLDVKESYSSVDGIGLNISTLQAAAAYHSVSQGGVYTKPRFVKAIHFLDGSAKEVEAETVQAMNPSVAYVLTQILRGVPQSNGGTAPSAQISEYKGYGGKTGTVAFADFVNPPAPYGLGASDAWYDSFTKDGYSVAIWTGYDSPNDSPQIPDTYKEYQVLGKNLQKLLNGNRSIENWTKPDGVTLLSGSDLSALYQVTDSKDILSKEVVPTSVQEISGIPEVKKVENETVLQSGWENELSASQKKLFDLWKKQPEILQQKDIQSEKLYKALRGGD